MREFKAVDGRKTRLATSVCEVKQEPNQPLLANVRPTRQDQFPDIDIFRKSVCQKIGMEELSIEESFYVGSDSGFGLNYP